MPAPDPALVKEELERILSSKAFRKSPVLSNFLRFVVTETVEDKVNEIKEYTIAVKALGKPADFNPQIDAVIRIHAGRLRRTLLEYYKTEGSENPLTISLKPGRYIPQFAFRENKKDEAETVSGPRIHNGIVSNRVAVLPFKNLSNLA